MTRKFPISGISHPLYDLKEPVEVEQQQTSDGWIAQCAALQLEGRGETWPLALQDLQDNIIAALEAGQPIVMAAVKERPEQPQSTTSAPTPLAAGKKVYVLLDAAKGKFDSVVGVTSDIKWAKRFARWSPSGDYREFIVDALEDEEDEKEQAGASDSGGVPPNAGTPPSQ